MADSIDAIRRRAELAALLPELIEGAAAYRWREDVTTLLAEVDRLRADLAARPTLYGMPIIELGDWSDKPEPPA